jgi:hypothetical protein
MKDMRRTRIARIAAIGALGCAALMLSVTLDARSRRAAPVAPPPAETSVASTAPAIAWSSNSVHIILSPGENGSRSLTFTSSEELRDVVVDAVPPIAGFLTISHSTISRVRSNPLQTIQLSFSIPNTATFGDYILTSTSKSAFRRCRRR